MPTEALNLPLPGTRARDVRLAYLRRAGDPAPAWEQAVLHLRTARMGPPGPALPGLLGADPWRRGYLKRVGLFAKLLASCFAREAFDCVLSPPSRFDHARPYREAILRRMPGAVDLSADFTRKEGTYAGCGHSLPALRRALSFHLRIPLGSLESVLIVDDILWQGKTASAVIHHLRRAGLPDEARIALACPLWID